MTFLRFVEHNKGLMSVNLNHLVSASYMNNHTIELLMAGCGDILRVWESDNSHFDEMVTFLFGDPILSNDDTPPDEDGYDGGIEIDQETFDL